MPTYFEIPEALDHVVGQAWLSPDEAPRRFAQRHAAARRLSLREALREIAAILRRLGPA